jgi:hypothetical protein
LVYLFIIYLFILNNGHLNGSVTSVEVFIFPFHFVKNQLTLVLWVSF